MGAKSVIEIDVLDDRFKAFVKEFDKYKKALDDQKKSWEESSKAAKQFYEGVQKSQDKFIQSLKEQNKQLNQSSFHFKNLNQTTTNIAKNIDKMATSMIKYVAYGALASGFGLGGLAANATNLVRASTQGGVSPNAIRAFRSTYGTYDPSLMNTLTNISNLQTSIAPEDVMARGQLGIGQNEDPAKIYNRTIERAVALYKQFHGVQQILDQIGVTRFIPYQQLKGLSNLPQATLKEMESGFQSKLGGPNELQADIQLMKFKEQLVSAGQTIEETLIKKIAPLSPILIKLADKLGDFLVAIINFLDYLPDVIRPLSKKEKEDIQKSDFFARAKQVEDIAKTHAEKYGDIKHPINAALYYGETLGMRNLNPGNLKFANQEGATLGEGGFAKFSSIEAGEKALEKQLRLYQTKHHIENLTQIVNRYAPKADKNDTEAYIKDIAKQTGFSPTEKLDLQNKDVLAKLMSAISQHESGEIFPVPAMQLIVNNQAGADINLTTVAGTR